MKVLYLSKGGDNILNQIVLVGRLTRNITVNKSDKGVKVATISLAIPRSFKNMEGGYDTDFIDCVAFDNIAENTKEFCEKGDIVGVKGRVQSRTVEKDGKTEYLMEIIAEKITFLSNKKGDEKADE
ncbi:MAG: single-stranded DNA-binding protein [Bacilli bacterium]|nr:single-stranded DNA-binding protein [Bacilli bacterium]